ncbi:MAG: hypothetical protein HY850_01175 [Betaproteobacteria bacterium]|nr:hypothetical protein [Betaproteobacteria bacterium]
MQTSAYGNLLPPKRTDDIRTISADPITQFFHRHVVPIHFEFRKGHVSRTRVVTAFVMAINEQWCLVTAGRCIERIENEYDQGYEIERCCLLDCNGVNTPHGTTIPFDYVESAATRLCYDPTYDCGVFLLSKHHVRLLRESGIEAMSEAAWEQQPYVVDFHAIIGVHGQPSASNAMQVSSTLHKVTPLPHRPDCFADTGTPTFWAAIDRANEVPDLPDLSGSPIFAFRQKENGEFAYWLHSIQNQWVQSRGLIAACFARPIGKFLKEVVEGENVNLVTVY